MKNKIEPDFIEEDFISAINSQLSFMSGSGLFANRTISRISQQSENDCGYDGYLNTLVPFYIQFKRSTLYNHKFKGALFSGRKAAGFNDKHGFYGFRVYKSPSHGYKQHNLLFDLNNKSGQKCAYVAPLFHKEAALNDLKLNRGSYPWTIKDRDIYDLVSGQTITGRKMRFFKNSITIVPHKEILKNEPTHYYTYKRNGEDACFHSKAEKLGDEVVLFSDFLNEIIATYERGSEGQPSKAVNWFINAMNQDREKYSNDVGIYPKFLRKLVADEITSILEKKIGERSASAQFEKLSKFDQLTVIENILRQEFNIHQYFLFGNILT